MNPQYCMCCNRQVEIVKVEADRVKVAPYNALLPLAHWVPVTRVVPLKLPRQASRGR